MGLNSSFVLRKRPNGLLKASDIEQVETGIPPIANGEMLIKTEALAMDPVTRVLINEDIGLVPPIKLGTPLSSFGGGTIAVQTLWRLLVAIIR